jgi:hypothetical protein
MVFVTKGTERIFEKAFKTIRQRITLSPYARIN